MATILKADKLRVEYRSREMRQATKVALAGLDLEVHAGEVFGFLGPNGAGKTTTMNVLLGFVQPTTGAASLFGIDVRQPITINFSPPKSCSASTRKYLGSRAAKQTSALTHCSNSSNWSTHGNVPSNPTPKACSNASVSRRRSSTIPTC